MQGGLSPFSDLESNQPLVQIQGSAQIPSHSTVTHNLLSGRDKGRDVHTAPETQTKRTAQGHPRVSGEPEPEASVCLLPWFSKVFAPVGQLQHSQSCLDFGAIRDCRR